MSLGTPVITSNLSSLPEVGGEAAIYIDPYDVNNIKQGLCQLLNLTTSQRNKLIKKGQAQAKKFSWEAAARETLELYRKSVGEDSESP
jgi:glycosyltransferase involved in cell wall biosynthesis